MESTPIGHPLLGVNVILNANGIRHRQTVTFSYIVNPWRYIHLYEYILLRHDLIPEIVINTVIDKGIKHWEW